MDVEAYDIWRVNEKEGETEREKGKREGVEKSSVHVTIKAKLLS